MSYWIYQHLGNLSPEDIAEEGLLARLEAARDGSALLRRWAMASDEFTPVPGGYRFSCSRDVGGVRLVMVDSRNGRVLEARRRRMVDEDEWAWVTDHALRPCDHLLVATSLPVFVPLGVHGLQQWDEALCDGRWGRRAARWGERLRRRLDLEDWAAFTASFDDMVALLRRVTSTTDGRRPPATVTVVSGDIHFAYVAAVHLDPRSDGPPAVRQVVSSPIRNALATTEREAIRFAAGRLGSLAGRVLGRFARRGAASHRFNMEEGPVFNNNIGVLVFESATRGRVEVERARWEADDVLFETVIDRPL